MEENSNDCNKTPGPPSPLCTARSGTGSVADADNNCGTSGGNLQSANSGTVVTAAGDSPITTRTTTTSAGVVIQAGSTAVMASSMLCTSETGSSMTAALGSGAAAATTAGTTAATTAAITAVTGGASTAGVSAAHGGSCVTKMSGSSPHSPKNSRKTRVKLGEQQLESATREELAAKWREQDLYIECLEAQAAAQEGELACLRDSEEKYRQQCCEITHRERILVRRLASKEQQILGYVNEIAEMRANQTSSASALRSALLDPAVNILIQKLRQELLSTKAKLEDTQNELSAWKFTPDSNTGKRLMAKCRLLYQENEELGRMIASGRIAKLEGELVLQKSFSEEVKKSQSELDEFLQDLDEDVEGMQSTIYFLQQELRKAHESVSLLQQENNAFKSVSSASSSSSTTTTKISPLSVPPQPPSQPPPPQPPPPPPSPPPPPPPNDSNGLSNGVAPLERMSPPAEPVNDGDTKKLFDNVKREDADEYSGLEGSASRIQLAPIATASTTLNDAKSETPELGGSVPDEPDESSNDSAALIIKVENEELSDRDDEDDNGRNDECAKRGSQSTRSRDKTSDSAGLVGNKSNGDETNSSRLSSRRLVRDRTAKRDKSAADSDDDRRLRKKKRRESILSLDYNETDDDDDDDDDDDALLLTNGESIQSDPDDGFTRDD